MARALGPNRAPPPTISRATAATRGRARMAWVELFALTAACGERFATCRASTAVSVRRATDHSVCGKRDSQLSRAVQACRALLLVVSARV